MYQKKKKQTKERKEWENYTIEHYKLLIISLYIYIYYKYEIKL